MQEYVLHLIQLSDSVKLGYRKDSLHSDVLISVN